MSVESMNNAAIELSVEELDAVTGGNLPSVPPVAINRDTFSEKLTQTNLGGFAGRDGAFSYGNQATDTIHSATYTQLPSV